MLLSDPRLKFADELVAHWLAIRGDALVPLEEDLVPDALRGCFDHLGIADLTRPAQVIFELAGAGLSRRFGYQNIAHINWVDLVPPALGDAGLRAHENIRSVPCGFYHEFTARRDGMSVVTAETLLLPLRHRNTVLPHAVIGVTRDHSGSNAPAGWLTPSAQIEHYFQELVDIAAGLPAEGRSPQRPRRARSARGAGR